MVWKLVNIYFYIICVIISKKYLVHHCEFANNGNETEDTSDLVKMNVQLNFCTIKYFH